MTPEVDTSVIFAMTAKLAAVGWYEYQGGSANLNLNDFDMMELGIEGAIELIMAFDEPFYYVLGLNTSEFAKTAMRLALYDKVFSFS